MNLPTIFIDVRAIVALMGGPQELAKKLTAAGVKTSAKALYKCSDRQSITGIRLAHIFELAKQERLKAKESITAELSLCAFIKDAKTVDPALAPPPKAKALPKKKPAKKPTKKK